MIEIIALVLLTRRIGAMAKLKGLEPGRWKWKTVLYWIGFEFVGITIGLAISHNLLMAALLGLGCAVGGYLLVQYRLENMPNLEEEHWMDRIGRQDR